MMRKLIAVFVFIIATMCAMIGVKRYRRIVSEYRDTSDILVVCASNHLNDAISHESAYRDAWGNDLVLNTNRQGNVVSIYSAGLDGVFNNSDDVTCKIELWGGRGYIMNTSWSYGLDDGDRLDALCICDE